MIHQFSFFTPIHFKPSLLFDPLSLFFVFVILLVSIPSAVYSIDYLKGQYSGRKIAYNWVMFVLFVFSMLLVVTSSNALLFLIAWEIMSLVSFFLVIFDHEHYKSVKAGIIYIVMTHIGTAFLIAAFLLMFRHSHSFDFSLMKLACQSMPSATRNIIFLSLLIGFGTKAGIVPLHIWLPYAHPQAPSHISAVMSGVMIKTAIYGLIRFVIYILGVNELWWGNLILVLASVSCLVGVMYALMEHDLKKLLAYHSVENIGIILLGIGASMVFLSLNMPVLYTLAMIAGLYHLVNHAIFKSLLFFCAGSVYKSTGLRDIEKLGGLIKTMPWTAIAFLTGSMAISALPPLNGFISEWLTFQAIFGGILNAPHGGIKILMGIYASALALTGGLAAACFVKAFGISFLAMPRSEEAQKSKEAPSLMIYVSISMAALALFFGLFAVNIVKVLSQIAQSIAGINLNSFTFAVNNLISIPQNAGSAYLSSPIIAFVLIFAIGISFASVYFFLPGRKASTGKTWGCGYYKLDSRTQYSATAFSKPFRIAFNFFYRPYRKTHEIKESSYHVKSRRYETFITHVFTKYIYESVLERVFGTANFMGKLQSGSIHFYLAYIFIVIVFLLIFKNSF
jgi:hydrogenase-4 component B